MLFSYLWYIESYVLCTVFCPTGESGPTWNQTGPFALRRNYENQRQPLPTEAPPLSVASRIVRAVKRSAGNPRQM